MKVGENYSADLKVKFSGITPDTLMDVEFVLVRTTFENVTVPLNPVPTRTNSTSINGSSGNVNEEYELTAKVTLDETSYQSLDADKAHLNIQGVTKLG